MKKKQSIIPFLQFLFVIIIFANLFSQRAFADLQAPKNLRTITPGDHNFYPGDYSGYGVIGNSLPGNWRPFSSDSPWNCPISRDAVKHPDSDGIINFADSQAKHIRFAKSYIIPVWVINSENIPPVSVKSDVIFDFWDQDRDGWSDVGVPITADMWAEPTKDGHICIIDPFKKISYEMSRFNLLENGTPTCTTFNIWDITSRGVGDSNQGYRWKARGGRGSGFPIIAGLLRPEEVSAGEIRHALVFTFNMNRISEDGSKIFLPPACRSDGKYIGTQYPIEGMRFQLDPLLTEKDFDSWGLNKEGKIIARALQRYGMYVCDNGGAMALQVQLLAPIPEDNYRIWEELFPGFHKNIENIPVKRFRVIYTGEPIIKN